jgi:hypothetical protein
MVRADANLTSFLVGKIPRFCSKHFYNMMAHLASASEILHLDTLYKFPYYSPPGFTSLLSSEVSLVCFVRPS